MQVEEFEEQVGRVWKRACVCVCPEVLRSRDADVIYLDREYDLAFDLTTFRWSW